MDKDKSFNAVKDAIVKEPFAKQMDVFVFNNGKTYIYHNVFVRITYNIAYMQMDVIVIWEDDSTQIDYQKLGLRGSFNRNFQEFSFENGQLSWEYNENKIAITF